MLVRAECSKEGWWTGCNIWLLWNWDGFFRQKIVFELQIKSFCNWDSFFVWYLSQFLKFHILKTQNWILVIDKKKGDLEYITKVCKRKEWCWQFLSLVPKNTNLYNVNKQDFVYQSIFNHGSKFRQILHRSLVTLVS